MKKNKRVVIISDLHCGHRVGLTPPPWWFENDESEKQAKIVRIQREMWNFFASQIDALKPIDILIVNGDAIDGSGHRSGGREQVSTDRLKQCEMAAYVIEYTGAKVVRMTYGTPYHSGETEDFESVIGDKLDVDFKIEGHAFPNINGVQFDIKHKIGSSGVPHGRYTALSREKLWNTVWASNDERQPDAGYLIRSHVHYHAKCGNHLWEAITTPALQGFGSIYGVRQCSGVVDVGFLVFDISSEGNVTWWPVIADLKHQKVQPEYL